MTIASELGKSLSPPSPVTELKLIKFCHVTKVIPLVGGTAGIWTSTQGGLAGMQSLNWNGTKC